MAAPKKVFQLSPAAARRNLRTKASTDASGVDEDDGAADLLPFASAPPPPSWLPNQAAIDEWRRLSRILVKKRTLTPSNVGGLGHLCAMHGKLTQLWAAGELPNAHMLAQHRMLMSEYNLTPASSDGKSRAAPKGGAGRNAFERNGSR